MGEPAQTRNPIDAFLLAKLEAAGLAFAPEADRRTLIRRATFDLWGLPPALEDIATEIMDLASSTKLKKARTS